MNGKTIDFREKYTSLKEKYADLIELNEEILVKIQAQIEKDNLKYLTNNYIVSVIGASLCIILFPFLITKIYYSLNIVTVFLERIIDVLPTRTIKIFNISFGFGGFSILVYLFFMPYGKLFGRIVPSRSAIFDVNRKQTNYVIASIFAVYVVLGLIVFLVYLNNESLRAITIVFFKHYLFVPIAIISFLLFMVLIGVVFILPFRKYTDKKFIYCRNIRIEISFLLFSILDKLKDYEVGNLIPQNDIVIIRKLKRAGTLIRNYPNAFLDYYSDKKIITDFEKAANGFENLIEQFIENQETNLKSIKDKVVFYVNIFLKGNLSELPKTEITQSPVREKKIKLYHYFFLLLYLTLPILIVIFLKLLFNISLDEYIHSLLKILYIIWAFVGVFSNPIIFSNENKDLMKDIIKTLIGKG